MDMFIISEGQIIVSRWHAHPDTIVRVIARRECVYLEFMEMLYKQHRTDSVALINCVYPGSVPFNKILVWRTAQRNC